MQLKAEDKNHYSLSKPSQKLKAAKDTTRNYHNQNNIKDRGVMRRQFISHEKNIVPLIRLSALFFCLSFWYVIFGLVRAIF